MTKQLSPNNTELNNSNTLITSTNNIELTSINTELTNNNLIVNGVTQDTEKDAFCCMSEYYGIGNEFVIGVAASTQNINGDQPSESCNSS